MPGRSVESVPGKGVIGRVGECEKYIQFKTPKA